MLELERFLAEELDRISIAIQQTAVMAAYGALYVSEPAAVQTVGTTHEIIVGWDVIAPLEPNRTAPNATTNNITMSESGVYYFSFTASINVSADIFDFELFRNGAGTGVRGVVDPSNQTDSVVVAFSGPATITAGDVVDVRARVTAGTGDITMISGAFTLFRISELHRGDPVPI